MRFVKVKSLLKDIDSENPNRIQASLKKAEKYLHRKVVYYLDNNNEEVLASRGSKLINLLRSAHDSIDTATDDEIEYMLDEIKSNVKRFDKGIKKIRLTPTLPVKASKTEESWKDFTRRLKLKTHPIRGAIDIVRVPVHFFPAKSHLQWNRKVAGNPQQIRRHGLELVEYNNYPILNDEYVLFIKKDFPPLIDYIENPPEHEDPYYDKLYKESWRISNDMQKIGEYMINTIGRRGLDLVVINFGREDPDEELGVDGRNTSVIRYKNFYAQWFISKPKQKIITQYFGKIKRWGIADGNTF